MLVVSRTGNRTWKQKLSAGEIVEIDIGLLPAGLVFYSGEQLRHVIHTGGEQVSSLQLPIRKSQRDR